MEISFFCRKYVFKLLLGLMVFQGPPFEDKDFETAITSLWDVMKSSKPETYGFAWADDAGPRFQLCPEGYRGYIEGRPVRPV